ncbi:P-loop containing nucleoside triphosphate hydrolase protein [Zopfochytrium polystomum]|nr:P-loop containing nucleoside triphosphate hydrolase protein [Zopfochytrium polystomum]
MKSRQGRFNAKARAATRGGQRRQRKKSKAVHDVDVEAAGAIAENAHKDVNEPAQADTENSGAENVEYMATDTAIPILIEPSNKDQSLLDKLPEPPQGKVTAKKRKRLEKFIEKQLKKEQRVNLLKKLGSDKFSSDLLRSSKTLGQVNLSAKEKLKQALKEYKSGIPFSDPDNRLFVEKEVDENELVRKEPPPTGERPTPEKAETKAATPSETAAVPTNGTTANGAAPTEAEPTSTEKREFGSSLKRKTGEEGADTLPPVPKKKKKKQKAKAAKTFSGLSESDSEHEDDALAEEPPQDSQSQTTSNGVGANKRPLWSSDVVAGEQLPNSSKSATPAPTMKPIPSEATSESKPKAKPSRPAFYVNVNRPEAIELTRAQLPVVAEEQPIVESVLANDCTILCGETGSGKTTQVPQFLYEAGFGDPAHPTYPGMIGVTQPRRIAAVSMAKRVAEELGYAGTVDEGKKAAGPVAYQIRYDASTVTEKTRIKFMTDGILLRELSGGNFSSSENGAEDLLLSKYSCIIIDEAHERTVGTDVLIGWLTRIVKLRNSGKIKGIGPLKLVIMSATLRVEDFTMNTTLFPETPPPVLKVEGRQYKVTIHYNRVTPEQDYVTEAFKKVSKIHNKLPPGAILVFLTGQGEITALVRKLRKAHGAVVDAKIKEVKGKKGGKSRPQDNTMVESSEPAESSVDPSTDLFEDIDDVQGGDEFVDNGEDDFDEMAQWDEDDEEEDVEVLNGLDGDDPENTAPVEKPAEKLPLHVLPLYSQLPTAAQLRVFEQPPPGTRLCVVATNVAETSLTIPGVKYVVDCGKVKERRYDATTGVQTFQVGWTSKASADQRAGRAGRLGPGHCYRLFSSAVFGNYFDQFSQPEITRVPIEGVILQMKSMGISNVVHFPFPTPPGTEIIQAGEVLLTHLGAIESERANKGDFDPKGRITELGRILGKFPISPRFSKMIVIAAKQDAATLNYTIAIAAGSSVGDPFIRDAEITGIVHQKKMDNPDSDDEGNLNEAEKKERSKKMGEWRRVMQMFIGESRMSDTLTVLRAIGAYSSVASKTPARLGQFTDSHFLRAKAMEEIQRLRSQLFNIAKVAVPGCALSPTDGFSPLLSPPTPQQSAVVRQILLTGFPDRVAKLDIEATRAAAVGSKKRATPLYSTMFGSEDESFVIHSSSCLALEHPAPQWIIYEEVLGKEEHISADGSHALNDLSAAAQQAVLSGNFTERRLLKNVTVISEAWLTEVGPKTLLRKGKPLEQPEPRYVPSKDRVMGCSVPNYGPRRWELPMTEIELEPKEAYPWFARALLEGDVTPGYTPPPVGNARKKVAPPPDMFSMISVRMLLPTFTFRCP